MARDIGTCSPRDFTPGERRLSGVHSHALSSRQQGKMARHSGPCSYNLGIGPVPIGQQHGSLAPQGQIRVQSETWDQPTSMLHLVQKGQGNQGFKGCNVLVTHRHGCESKRDGKAREGVCQRDRSAQTSTERACAGFWSGMQPSASRAAPAAHCGRHGREITMLCKTCMSGQLEKGVTSCQSHPTHHQPTYPLCSRERAPPKLCFIGVIVPAGKMHLRVSDGARTRLLVKGGSRARTFPDGTQSRCTMHIHSTYWNEQDLR